MIRGPIGDNRWADYRAKLDLDNARLLVTGGKSMK